MQGNVDRIIDAGVLGLGMARMTGVAFCYLFTASCLVQEATTIITFTVR